MKELSVEEKARRYDEAIKVANNILEGKCKNFFVYNHYNQGMIEYIFPELAESEDEKIKKELIEFLKEEEAKADITSKRSKTLCKYITWLEKQGQKPQGKSAFEAANEENIDNQNRVKLADKVEPKFKVKYAGSEYNVLEVRDIAGVTYYGIEDEPNHIDYVLPDNCEIVSEQKPADKVEPKFKVGDWIIYDRHISKVKDMDSEGYLVEDTYGDEGVPPKEFTEKHYRLWTIQDAKDGDVLASNRSIFIFSQEYIAGKPEAHCGIMNGLFLVKSEGCWTNEKYYPATKEQRDTLMKAMADAGYTFDFEKKELKKI